MEEQQHIHRLNKEIKRVFLNMFLQNIWNIRAVYALFKNVRNQTRAAALRMKREESGICVPAFMIFSVTNRCNLHCKGCYITAQGRPKDVLMSTEKLKDIFRQARELGISIALVSGGEPLTRKDIFEVLREFPEIIVVLFTNGLLINNSVISEFKQNRHIIPIMSIEGYEQETDARRGDGVFGSIEPNMEKMKSEGIVFGTSVTVTRKNYKEVVNRQFIKNYMDLGCRVFFFIEYIPVEQGTEGLVITEQQRDDLMKLIVELRAIYNAVFFLFPSGEEDFGGCLAAGRGFIHINSAGMVEPCPFSPFSDSDLNNISLKDALQSRLLKTIRDNRDVLKETPGSCMLWENQDFVKSLIKKPPRQ